MKHCARILDQSKCVHFVFVVKQLRLWPKKLVFHSYRCTKRGCWPHVTSDSPNVGVVFVVHCPCARIFEVPYISITIVLALCFTSNKPLLQLYQTVTNLRFEVPFEIYSVHTPEVSPHTIEHVICCFWLVLDLVLVLACSRPACSSPFHPIAKTTLFSIQETTFIL